MTWLQPAPDSLLAGTLDDPATVVVARHTMRLAFIAALQVLPPRQRAVLILRDVLQWRSSEVASLLDLSVGSGQQCIAAGACASASRSRRSGRTVRAPTTRADRSIRSRIRKCRRRNLVAVLTEDADVRDAAVPHLVSGLHGRRRFPGSANGGIGDRASVVRSSANGQPAVALYTPADGGEYRLHALHVVTVMPEGVHASWHPGSQRSAVLRSPNAPLERSSTAADCTRDW